MNMGISGYRSENRHEYFIRRLKEIGMYDGDSDYDGEIGTVVEKMSEAFSSYGHSGGSAHVTMGIFNQLMTEWESGEAFTKFKKGLDHG
ncbi:hypothetical protein MUP59_07135 [Candidatus Bathyarchaeota archaeon]|nr:hypothetical protein [Candidatus Bathyarchaeota archaeon]